MGIAGQFGRLVGFVPIFGIEADVAGLDVTVIHASRLERCPDPGHSRRCLLDGATRSRRPGRHAGADDCNVRDAGHIARCVEVETRAGDALGDGGLLSLSR